MSNRISEIVAVATLLALQGCATGPSTGVASPPTITAVETDPMPPVAPRIRWIIKGSAFDRRTVRVFFTGPGCPDGCEVPPGAIDRRTDTEVSGLADLAVGTYQLTARNGDNASSNGVSITLIGR